MLCPKCKSTILEKVDFCPYCGENLTALPAQDKKFCSSCGGEIKEGNLYCAKCGARTVAVTQTNTSTTPATYTSSSDKITGSYLTSVISAIISFVIRLITQDTFYSWDNLWENRKVLGIDSDLKPYLSAIPAIAAIIVSLLIASDTDVPTHKKTTAFIVNIVFIVLSVLFIWFDIPSEIFNF